MFYLNEQLWLLTHKSSETTVLYKAASTEILFCNILKTEPYKSYISLYLIFFSSVSSTFHKKDEMCAHFFALPIFQSKLANTSPCVKELLKICIPRKFYIQFFFVFAIQILLFIANTLNTHILLPHMSEKIIWKSANVTYILPEVLEIKHSLKREEVKIKRLILLGCLYRQYRKACLKGNQNYETKYSHLS